MDRERSSTSICRLRRRSETPRRHGFTLIEILIVVVIVGVLAAMVVPRFADARRDASVSAVRNQLQALRGQLDLYRIRYRGAVPPADALMETLVAEALIRSTPEWPAGFAIDETHYAATGSLRLSYDPTAGGDQIDVAMVEAW
jgi:general secretion pathway protein G